MIVRRPVILLAPIVAAAATLLVYLYIPIRAGQAPVLAYNHPDTVDRLVELVSGAQFREKFGFLAPSGPGRLIDDVPPARPSSRAVDNVCPRRIEGIAMLLRAGRRSGAPRGVAVGLCIFPLRARRIARTTARARGRRWRGSSACARSQADRCSGWDRAGRLVAALWAVVAVAPWSATTGRRPERRRRGDVTSIRCSKSSPPEPRSFPSGARRRGGPEAFDGRRPDVRAGRPNIT